MSWRKLLLMLVPDKGRELLAAVALPSAMRESYRALLRARRNARVGRYKSDVNVLGYEVRRLAHILEKGLCHPAWEPGHGQSIRGELAGLLEEFRAALPSSDPTLIWAAGILQEYEEAQESGFNSRTLVQQSAGCAFAESFAGFLRSRRSVRQFSKRQIEVGQIEEIVAAVNWSPTSCNRQSAQVFATLDAAKTERVARRFAGCTGFSTPIPVIIVFCSDLRAYSMPMEQHLPAIDISLGVQACALMAHSIGLSMTLMSWAHHSPGDDQIVREVLGIPDWCQIIVGAVVGYPSTSVPAPGRKHLSQTLRIV